MMRSEIAGFRAPVYLLGDRGKQEYQRVSPDCPGANGRKPSLRPCREDDSGPDGNGRITIASYTFDSKPKPRSASGSASTTPDRPPFPHIAEAEAPAATASPNRAAKPLDVGGSGVGAAGSGSGLLQWGHNKRSRGSRAAADESSSGGHARQVIKIQRRSSAAAEKAAAEKAAMPPPGASYTRGANLRPCTPVRDATSPLLSRSVEERSGGHKRSPPKAAAAAAAAAPTPNAGESGSKPSSELETGSSSGAAAAAPEKLNLDRFEWPRIYLSLSRKEKEDDFLAMKGTKLPQRPKKRAKNVEKALQYCFPGMWLSDLTRGRYEVREKKCVKKKRRGLKGMESMDSDSD